MNLIFKKIILSASAVSCVGIASANSILTLDDGNGHSTTISTSTGVVSFTGSLGDWQMNFSTGLGFPALGTQTSPILDVLSLNVYNGSGGAGNTLKITFTEDNLGPINGSLQASIGGTIAPGSSLVFNTWLNGNLLTSESFLSSGAFSGSQLGSGTGGFPSTLTLEGIITATSKGANTSFDGELRAVPDGGTTIALFGFALLGLDGIRRRFAKVS